MKSKQENLIFWLQASFFSLCPDQSQIPHFLNTNTIDIIALHCALLYLSKSSLCWVAGDSKGSEGKGKDNAWRSNAWDHMVAI